jgi:hypothetical protein
MTDKQQSIPCGCKEDQVCQFCAEIEEKENDIKALVIEYLQKLPGAEVTEVETTGRKKGNIWVKAKESEGVGRADLFLCYFGRYVEVELKRPGVGKRSKEQKDREKKIRNSGGQYWLVDSLEQFIVKLKAFKLKIT